MDELKSIMEKFAASGWERIAAPARATCPKPARRTAQLSSNMPLYS